MGEDYLAKRWSMFDNEVRSRKPYSGLEQLLAYTSTAPQDQVLMSGVTPVLLQNIASSTAHHVKDAAMYLNAATICKAE